VVCVVHVEVHAAEANDLMELVTALVDFAKTRHENANLFALLVGSLGQHPRDMAHGCFREVRSQVLRDVEDAWLAHSVYVKSKTKPEDR
jgi:hypothetical protein